MTTPEPYGKKNPFPAPVINNYPITQKGSPKEAIHIEFSLANSDLEYTTGDALAVIPTNNESVVDQFLSLLPFAPDTEITTEKGTQTLKTLLTESYDITNLNKGVLNKWSAYTAENSAVRTLLANEDKEALTNYCWGRDYIDLMQDSPATFTSPDQLLVILKSIAPRLYSIASSPIAHPGEVHLAVGVVRYTAQGRDKEGVCSSYMADRVGQGPAKVFIHNNKNFRLPEDRTKPVIMVGPGTGIAPFRAFIEERVATQATGGNWFFFGNPYRATDFLYEEWLTQLENNGQLKLDLAFSRDQAEKLYVQHLMVQNAQELWSWLKKGAYFYVCGDAARMAKDVNDALKSVIQTQGQMTEDEAEAYIQAMKKDKRYQRDVY